jgi:uncharacterized protein YodC (DUF2158 family)
MVGDEHAGLSARPSCGLLPPSDWGESAVANNSLNAGDVVQLKSGGPWMTVQRTYDSREIGALKAVCEWFIEGGTPKEQAFAVTSLQLRPKAT